MKMKQRDAKVNECSLLLDTLGNKVNFILLRCSFIKMLFIN
jgi:hypothetical protein